MQGAGFGHQASPVFTIILSFLNLSVTLLVQRISMIKAASACKLEGLQTDVYHMYTEHLLLSKTDSWILAFIRKQRECRHSEMGSMHSLKQETMQAVCSTLSYNTKYHPPVYMRQQRQLWSAKWVKMLWKSMCIETHIVIYKRIWKWLEPWLKAWHQQLIHTGFTWMRKYSTDNWI